MRASHIRPPSRGVFVAIALGALCALGTFAVALQVQVVGGHALDANLQVDGSGFNTVSSRNRAPGLQRQAYNITPSFGGGNPALSSGVYRPGRGTSGSVDTRISGARGFALSTGAGTISGAVDPRTGRGAAGRADPLRVPNYSVLQTPVMVQRASIPGGTGITRVNRRTGGMMTSGMTPSNAMSSTKYSAVRRF